MKKKKIIIAIVVALILIAGTFTITVLAENGGLIDGIKSKMKTNVNASTDAKIEAATAQIQAKVEEEMSAVLTYQTGRINGELGKYIDDKIENLSTGETFNNASQEVVVYATQLIAEEKARIDQVIEDMLS